MIMGGGMAEFDGYNLLEMLALVRSLIEAVNAQATHLLSIEALLVEIIDLLKGIPGPVG